MNFLKLQRGQRHIGEYRDFEFINHHKNRRKMKFNPGSDYVQRSRENHQAFSFMEG